jgi:hypothetical protein
MVDVEWYEWFTCMCECCNGKWVNDKHGMIDSVLDLRE